MNNSLALSGKSCPFNNNKTKRSTFLAQRLSKSKTYDETDQKSCLLKLADSMKLDVDEKSKSLKFEE